jgi:hypothetical protein
MNRPLGKLTYANVVSTLALFLVVAGGGAFAASKGSSGAAAVRLCAARKDGALRLPSGGSCRAGEQALTVDARGAAGATGPAGPAGAAGERGQQGERGANGPAGLVSPDGHFQITATDGGIVLIGPKGSATFDGEELRSDRSLKITAPINFTLTDGVGLEITSGNTTSFTTGGSFAQTVGGNYDETVGAGYSQNVGLGYEQDVGGTYRQSVGNEFTQDVDGSYATTVEGPFSQSVLGAWKAASGGKASLLSSSVVVGDTSPCAAAARVGSFIEGAGKIESKGSSSDVLIC